MSKEAPYRPMGETIGFCLTDSIVWVLMKYFRLEAEGTPVRTIAPLACYNQEKCRTECVSSIPNSIQEKQRNVIDGRYPKVSGAHAQSTLAHIGIAAFVLELLLLSKWTSIHLHPIFSDLCCAHMPGQQ